MQHARCYPVARGGGGRSCSVQVRHSCRTRLIERRDRIVSWTVVYAVVAILAALAGSARA